jgi:N-methylhydantoinase B
MYQISGGYGGNAGRRRTDQWLLDHRHLQIAAGRDHGTGLPVLYRQYALREGSGGAGKHRGGFGLVYEVELLRGEARASFVMDHGRFGPQGVLGGGDGGKNRVTVFRDDKAYTPAHLSKEQDIPLKAGDRVRVETPGGGGYGDPTERDPELTRHDRDMGYYPASGQ